MNPNGLPAALLSRIEDAGLNASAPPQQRWLDGWIVRLTGSFGVFSSRRAAEATPLAAAINRNTGLTLQTDMSRQHHSTNRSRSLRCRGQVHGGRDR